ncbi:TonB-dependent receptor [Ideonella sp. YS5]|uniref:TonB-dependent receptor n=1 Tax=Ideonella sp. YS5 TaxID=3453714 RepID=UPI003EEF7C07
MTGRKQFRKTTLSIASAQAVLLWSDAALAQDVPAPAAAASAAASATKKEEQATQTVVVTGQRRALESAQSIKRHAEEIVDSIVADDIGKLPDKSVTEVLQRMPGVTIDRTLNRADPQQGVGDGIQHFAAEGTGVSIRGLSYVRSELNGRDSFSANGGRALSFEDVPPELMAGIDVYKNPSAEQIEGGIGGLVNLRTARPFDFSGLKGAFSVELSRSMARGKDEPSFSGLLSNTWDTDLGKFGVLVDLAHSKIATHSDGLLIAPYIRRTDAVVGDTSGQERWIISDVQWRANDFDRTRDGLYAALQWKKGDLSSSLTLFRSKYKMVTTEIAAYRATDPSKVTLDPDATFDANGALLTGTIRAPQDGAPDDPNVKGVGFSTVSRLATRDSDTRDISWNVSWNASPKWSFQSDLQFIRATSAGTDYAIGLGGWMPKMIVDLGASPARTLFDDSDRAYLADPDHYYWAWAQEHRDHAVATEKAWRADAKYSFENDPVLDDLRFGVRLTQRDAQTRSTHDFDWAQITAPWAVGNAWQPFSQLAWLSDPRFAGDTHLHNYDNFFGGQVPMPAGVIVADASLLNDAGFRKVHGYADEVCQVDPCWASWTPAKYGDDKGLNIQRERTTAMYGQLRFRFDDLPMPIDGHAGVRVVRTESTASGYTLFSPPIAEPGVPEIPAQSAQQDFKNSFTNVLPSLNLRMKVGNELQFRFAASKGITRPELWQMQAYTTLSQNVHHTGDVVDFIDYSGSARGNPMLEPTQSVNLDLSAEYYFGRSGSLTLAIFNKDLKDIIIGRTSVYTLLDVDGQPHDFSITAPVNGAKGTVNGIELGYQQYFDKLPGWLSGFGVSGNYTYIDSRMTMNQPLSAMWCTPKDTVDANLARDLLGCDTDGRVLGHVPMVGLSRNAFNLALLYDQGPFSARLAYTWRSKYLQAINAYGTAGNDGIDQNPASPNFGQSYSVNYALPTWGGAYGQLDMGLQYKATDNLTFAFEGQNLTDALYKQYMQQGIGLKERGSFYAGRRYTLQMRYTF